MIRHRWRSHLKTATDEAAVRDLARRYLAEWGPAERAQVPPHYWPQRIESRADLASYALELSTLHADFRGDPHTLGRLQDLLLFFTHASVRATQLAHGMATTRGTP